MAKVLCGCGRPATEAACGACLGALRAAAGAKNDAARETLRLAAEVARLRAILDAPQVALFADGREPTANERHLLNLLSWREREAVEARAEIARLRGTSGR